MSDAAAASSSSSAAAVVAAAAVESKKAEGSAPQEAPKHSTSVPARLTDDELLAKHYPRYFYDKEEKIFPVDLNKYTVDQSAVGGGNGVAAPSKDGKHTWLIYMNYYLFDGGIAKLGGRGGHKYDLEIVIVEISIANQHVTGVFYGPHSSFEHMWIRHEDDLESLLDSARRPKVYISLGKHASYPVAGRVRRLFGLGTDSCQKPRRQHLPLCILDEHARGVDRIDGVFAGPKRRITRDWSLAPEVRIKDVAFRRAVPPAAQVRKELTKLFSFK
ncbi:unnamed protein product [Scytosiphon promiscuus]